MKTFNLETSKERRRGLRRNQTDAERTLWNKLRNKQLGGYKFFRQYGIANYIVDFYCPLLKVVIEIDGGQHYSQEGMAYDHQRNEFLKVKNIRVVRFSNLDVLKNIEGVFENLQKELPQPLFIKKRGANKELPPAPLYKKEGS